MFTKTQKQYCKVVLKQKKTFHERIGSWFCVPSESARSKYSFKNSFKRLISVLSGIVLSKDRFNFNGTFSVEYVGVGVGAGLLFIGGSVSITTRVDNDDCCV